MPEQEQNRTEQATPFKRSEARKRGQVAKSLDFNLMVMMAGFFVALSALAPRMLSQLMTSFQALFIAAGHADEPAALFATLHEFARAVWATLMPVCLIAVLLAVVANIVQAGPVLSADPVKPRLDRLNPLAGFKRIYNKRIVIEGLKALIKLGCFAALTVGFFKTVWPAFPDLLQRDTLQSIDWLADHAHALVFRILLALLIIGLMDVLWSRWQFSQQLMMSRREVKEEVKRREGDPLVRQRVRELQRENLKQARSLGRVRDADVLITNPNHLAIALAYDRTHMKAPQVIAKGADLWAQEMKCRARQHGIALVENRKLARTLFKRGVIDQPIPVDSYVEVAQVYASLSRARATVLGGAARASQSTAAGESAADSQSAGAGR